MKLVPARAEWPFVEFVFDEPIEDMHCLAFSEWHGHFDEWEDERRNLVEAIQVARQIAGKELCVVEELDAMGKCLGGWLLERYALPETVSYKAQKFRRVVFDEVPADEEIDFHLYTWTGHLYMLRSVKEKTEAMYRELGMESPFEETEGIPRE